MDITVVPFALDLKSSLDRCIKVHKEHYGECAVTYFDYGNSEDAQLVADSVQTIVPRFVPLYDHDVQLPTSIQGNITSLFATNQYT